MGTQAAEEFIRKNTPSKNLKTTAGRVRLPGSNRSTDPRRNLYGQSIIPRTSGGSILIAHNIGWTENSEVVFPTGYILHGKGLKIERVVDDVMPCYLILSVETGSPGLIFHEHVNYLPEKIYFYLSAAEMFDNYSIPETCTVSELKKKLSGYKPDNYLMSDAIVLREGKNKRLAFDQGEDINPGELVELCSSVIYVTEAKKAAANNLTALFPFPRLLPILQPKNYIARVQEYIVTEDVNETGYIVHLTGGVYGFAQCKKNIFPGLWSTIKVIIDGRDLLVAVSPSVDLTKYNTDVLYKCKHHTDFSGDGLQGQQSVSMDTENDDGRVTVYTDEENALLSEGPIKLQGKDVTAKITRYKFCEDFVKNATIGVVRPHDPKLSDTIVDSEKILQINTTTAEDLMIIHKECTRDYKDKNDYEDIIKELNDEIIVKVQALLSKVLDLNFSTQSKALRMNISVSKLCSKDTKPSPHIRFPKEKMETLLGKEDKCDKVWIGILPLACTDKMTVRVWDKPWSALYEGTPTKYTDTALDKLELLLLPAESVHQEITEKDDTVTYVLFVFVIQEEKREKRGRPKSMPGHNILFTTIDNNELSIVCK